MGPNTITQRTLDFTPHNLSLFHVEGREKGPSAYLQGAIHGSEIQGTLVLYELLDLLTSVPVTGTVTIVPLANPMASLLKIGAYTYGRFNPVTGENWNRSYLDICAHSLDVATFAASHQNDSKEAMRISFKEAMVCALEDHEKRAHSSTVGLSTNEGLALALQKLAIRADVVLDIHTGPRACRYLYAPESRKEESRALHCPHTILIPPLFAGALDEALFVPWHTLEKELKALGKGLDFGFSSYTVECGSEEQISRHEARREANSILSYLAHRGIVGESPKVPGEKFQFCLLEHFKTYHAPASGWVEYLVAPGQSFEQGQSLAHLYTPSHTTPPLLDKMRQEIRAPEKGVLINHFPSALVPVGARLFQVMTQVT